MKLMRDCAREALKIYEDKKKVLEEKKNRGIKLGQFKVLDFGKIFVMQ